MTPYTGLKNEVPTESYYLSFHLFLLEVLGPFMDLCQSFVCDVRA